MELIARLTFFAALLSFALALQAGRKYIFAGASMLGLAMLFAYGHETERPKAVVADEEIRTETVLIDQAAALAKRAHHIIDNTPRTKNESSDARRRDGDVARFYLDEEDWLNRAEHGKQLGAYVDHRAATAAIRIVAADSFLTGAVQSAVENCNDRDSALNIALADKIIDDARKSLAGRGDPNFPTPDLSRQLDGSNNCIDDDSP